MEQKKDITTGYYIEFPEGDGSLDPSRVILNKYPAEERFKVLVEEMAIAQNITIEEAKEIIVAALNSFENKGR